MRNSLLFTFLFCSLGILAQTNETLKSNVKTKITVDNFSNSKVIETEYWKLFGKSDKRREISGNISKVDDKYYINLVLFSNIGCIDQYSESLWIRLTSGDLIKCMHVDNTVCGKNPRMKFELASTESIEKLKSYDWEFIRIIGTKGFVDNKPNKFLSQSEQFFRLHLIAIDK